MSTVDEHQKERLRFVDFWADYVRTHDDREWSSQQNLIINSCLRSTGMTREMFLRMKGESPKKKKRIKKE